MVCFLGGMRYGGYDFFVRGAHIADWGSFAKEWRRGYGEYTYAGSFLD